MLGPKNICSFQQKKVSYQDSPPFLFTNQILRVFNKVSSYKNPVCACHRYHMLKLHLHRDAYIKQ